jgi:Tfp pilus assembly protein PilF
MKSGFIDSHTIKKYLLGNLAGTTEHEDIEKRMMSDGPFHSEIELAEIELIEEYLDRSLNVSEIKDFEANFLAAPERKAKFRFMLALKEKASEHALEKNRAAVTDMPHPPMPRRGVFLNDWLSSSLPAFAALGLIVIVGIGLWSYYNFNRADGKITEGLAALNTAYPNQRPTEARLSVFDYAPHPITRGPQSETSSRILDKAGLLLLAAVEETPGAESYRALGLYYASKQESQKALDQFELGLLYKPSDGQFYSDYGAVLLEMAKSGPKVSADARLRFLENSLSQLDKALNLNSDSLPALFNKALCLQELNSSGAARDAWQKYLEKDASSPWAKEAREKLKALDEKDNGARSAPEVLDDFMKAYDQRNEVRAWKIAAESKEMITGTMISDQLTRGLLSADAQGAPEDADRMLSALNFLGLLEKKNSGDIFFSDLAEFYTHADRGQRLKLQQAQLLTLEGYELCKNAQYIEALEKFKQSRGSAKFAGSRQDRLLDQLLPG